MAIMKNGLLGGITGKLCNTVCYMLNGKQVVRMNVKSTRPPTEKQKHIWSEMGIVAGFLRQVKPLIDIGYGFEAKREKRVPYNMAFSYLKKNGLKGVGADRQMDYPKIQLSRGILSNLRNMEAMLADNELTINWSPDCNGLATGSDQVMLLAYFPSVEGNSSEYAVYTIADAIRADGEQVLQLPLHFAGRPMELYVFVLAANGKSVSDTQYIGRL